MSAPPRTSFATSRPVAILVLFVAAFVFGWLSLYQLPLTLMPELTYPTLTVRTQYPGAAPEEVENDVSRPIEEALGVIGGLRRLSSVSRAGVSDVSLEFGWDVDMTEATQDVLEKLDRVFLPEEADRPLILHYDPSLDPVLELSLSGTGDRFAGEQGLRRLRRIADLQVRRQLEPVKGVAAVRVRGGLEEEIHVLLDQQQLQRTGISIRQVIGRLGEENINVAGGTLREGRTEYLVRTLNEYRDLDQIADTVVASFEGRDIRVRDLGRVERTHKDREIVTRTDGGESVQIDVFKEGDANVVALAGRVKALLGADTDSGLAAQLRRSEGVDLALVADRSVFIEQSVSEVKTTAVVGGLLAVLVLYLFLRRVKSTAIIAVSIPISVFIAFAPLKLLGVSLNIMSLGGLAMGIGMLVDSSIVVLESIFRCREEGDDTTTAAVRGTQEVRAAVVASTLTSIAVFLPMVFVEGIAGQAFGDLGVAVVVSLLASLVVAVYFIPMLASRRGTRMGGGVEIRRRMLRLHAWEAARRSFRSAPRRLAIVAWPYFAVRLVLGTVFEVLGKLLMLVVLAVAYLVRFVWYGARRVLPPLVWIPLKASQALLDALHRVYPSVLRWALGNPLAVIAIMAASVVATWQLGARLDSELLPEVHQGEFTVEVALPVGTPLVETDATLAPVERAILAEKGRIRSLLLTLGYDSATSQRSDEGENTARFKVVLDERSRDARSEDDVIARIRQRLAAIPDVDSRVVRPVLFSSRTPIEVEIRGDDLHELRRLADRGRELLAGLPELADVESTLRPGAPEVQVIYDRDRLARYGLNIGEVARLVRDEVKGYEATKFNLRDRRIPIVVRLGLEDRESVAEVRNLDVNPGGDRPIPLSAVADVALGEGPSEVRRVDGRRVAVIGANIATGSLSAAVDRIRETLGEGIDWPRGTSFEIAGQNEEWQRSRASLWLALGLSVFLVYVIMAAQFESLVQPLVIMLSIPLAFLGSVATLAAIGTSLSIVVFLGMIMLAGIVVNNAIVLVDYVNTLRARGMARDEAIVTAGRVRLRPILMTTATTVLGLLPMALGIGEGAELRTPMAITVISGLISSTVLTLVLIPAFYAMVDSIRERIVGGAPAVAAVDRELPGGAGAEGLAT